VIDGDAEVDALEAAGDALILQVISRNSPQASDLRRVITVSKSVTDLEKIGDEAVRVASLLHEMDGVSTSVPVTGLRKAMEEVGRRALDLLQEALGLFEVWDQRRALAVIEGQRQMDGQFQQALRHVMMRIQDERLDLGLAIRFVLVAKSMDRVAHHALNLAEYALFAEQGEDLRVLQPLDSTNRSAQES
jgi:phosphate transport system protein